MSDVLDFIMLALASGRVGFSLTRDEIFRPLREWVWIRSAPDSGMIRIDESDVPARFVDRFLATPRERDAGSPRWIIEFDPHGAPRERGFFGQLLECPYCMTFWTSAAACAAWMLLGDAAVQAAVPLAMWAAANTYATKGL